MATPILVTKLNIPPLRPEAVPRRRLLDRLETGLSRKLTLVSAPAGFGKTTLLSEWHASEQGRKGSFAWVLLDEQDNDPVRFWSYVLAALETAWPGIGRSAAGLLDALASSSVAASGASPRLLQRVLTVLVNDLSSADSSGPAARPLVLALDDYHIIHAPAVHDSLAFFLDYLPPSLHMVILTRADPPLALARLRARGHLLELRAADLRFTAGEAELFLNQAMALGLPTDAVSTLEARTEGWAAGLQLAALSLQGLDARQAQRSIEAFAGTHRHVFSYLTEEVLQRQPAEVQSFLLQTSILPYLSAALCEAVTGRPGSQAMLDRLAGENLFTIPLDGEGQWFRYHALFAESLRTRLQQASPDLLPALHLRACEWHEGQGALVDAVRHALAAGEPERAADLVEAGYKRLAMRGELVTLHRWLDALPPELVQPRPRLCLAYALALAYTGRREQVEGYLQQAESASAESGAATAAPVLGEIAAFRAVFSSVNWAGPCALELARRALELLPPALGEEDLWLRVLTLQAKANCHRFQGEAREAEKSYAEAMAAARTLDSPFLVQAVTNRLGQNLLLQGRLRQAAQTFESALRLAEENGGEMLWFSGELHAHLTTIYTEWDELDRALRHARQGIELSRQAGNHVALVPGYLALAGVESARGDGDAADRALDQAQQWALQAGGHYFGPLVAAHCAWLSLSRSGSRAPEPQVRRWAEDWSARRARVDDELPPVLREFHDLILARFRLAEGRPDQALRLLDEIEPAAERAGRMTTVLQALLFRAQALRRQGHAAQAQEMLDRALVLAEPENHRRFWAADPGFLKKASPSQRPSIQNPESRIQGLLTRREHEILSLMAAGAPNHEIAGRLVVTVGTVKGHINHILGKLGARNRTEAVARARELKLLDP